MKKNHAILQKKSVYYNNFENKSKKLSKKLKTHVLVITVNLVIGLTTFGILTVFNNFSNFIKDQNKLNIALQLCKNKSNVPKFYILKDNSGFNQKKNIEFYMIDDERIDMLKF
jgi:hypothetical protein